MTKQATAARLVAMAVTVVVLAWLAGTALAADGSGVPAADPAPSPTPTGGAARTLQAPAPPSGAASGTAGGGIAAGATTTEVLDNGDGTATVTILLSLVNGGNSEVRAVSLVDDVVRHLADLSPSGFLTLDGSLLANPRWDGTGTTSAVADGQTLQPGQSGDVGISFTVEAHTSTVANQVVAEVTRGDGEPITAAATNVVELFGAE
jgi:hypothetical protein